MRWRSRLAASAVVLALVPALASCGRATPLCDYAASLVKGAQLTAASDAYATAGRNGEGKCADDGLAKVGQLQASAVSYDAKGRAAARAGDKTGAQASFRAALGIDKSDGAAASALGGLGQPTPAPEPSLVLMAGPMPEEPAPAGSPLTGQLVWAALAVGVLALAANASLWILARRRLLAVEGAADERTAALAAKLTGMTQDAVAASRVATAEAHKAVDQVHEDVLRLVRNSLEGRAVDEEYRR